MTKNDDQKNPTPSTRLQISQGHLKTYQNKSQGANDPVTPSNEEVKLLMTNNDRLHDTKWLAERLNISISTIEKLRAKQSNEIPSSITINHTIRYSESYVEWWLQKKLNSTALDYPTWLETSNQNHKTSANKISKKARTL